MSQFVLFFFLYCWLGYVMTLGSGGTILTYALINVKPELGGGGGRCGAFDFSDEFLAKIPSLGPEK